MAPAKGAWTPEEATMTAEIGMDEMLRRVVRFKDLRSSRTAFLDSPIPGHEREIFTGLALDAEGNLRVGRRT